MRFQRLLFSILFIWQFLHSFGQKTLDFLTDVELGKYPIGHKKMIVFDSTRSYDFTLGDSSLKLASPNASRPILLNMFFPCKSGGQKNRQTIKDLYQFQSDDNTKHFLSKFKDYEMEMSKMYAFDENLRFENYNGDSSTLKATIEKLFGEYLDKPINVIENAEILKGKFPVIIYHQGLGGTFDENLFLLEYLSSHGFIVITSSFCNSESSWSLGVGDTEASLLDIDYIISFIKKQEITKSDKFFLMGHSFGANTIVCYPQIGKHKVAGIVPLDSDYGYLFYDMMRSKFRPDRINQYNYRSLPIMALGRKEAHFRMIDLFDKSNRYFINVEKLKHNDFCSQTILGLKFCLDYFKTKDEQNQIIRNHYSIYPQILTYLKSITKNDVSISFKKVDSSVLSLSIKKPDQRLEHNQKLIQGKGECPSYSQLLDYIYEVGMIEAGKEWLNCSNIQDTSVFDYEWLNVFEALLNDTSTNLAIDYFNWFIKNRKGNHKLAGFVYITLDASNTDYGNGFHYYKGNEVFNSMALSFPNDLSLLKGQIRCKFIEEVNANEEDKKSIRKELSGILDKLYFNFPNFDELPTENYWDESVKRIIKKVKSEN
jgi:hypothetical protein